MPPNMHRLNGLFLPTFPTLVSDLGSPSAGEIAAALGVDRSTVSGWLRRGAAPRPAMLALFWVSSWGASELDCELVNRATLAVQTARAHDDENARLRRQLARLLAVADFGAANLPVFDALTPADLLSQGQRRVTPTAF